MQSRMVILFIFLITVYSSINYYIGWHLTDWLDAVGISYSPWSFWIPFGIIAYGYILGRFRLPAVLLPAGRLLKVIGSYFIFFMEAAFLLFVLYDLIKLIVYATGSAMTDYSLYAGSAVVALLIVLFAIGSRNAWSPIVRQYELNIDKEPIPGGQVEWTVAVASDIHLGNTVGRKHLAKLVSRVNAMKPDLILLPGDVIDDSIEPYLRNRMGEVLGQLKSERGIYAVLGNHEYFGGHIEQYVAEMKKIGIQVLRDETVDIGGELSIAGRKDKTAESAEPSRRLGVNELISSLDHAKPIILMDHQPTKFAAAAEAGADVMLSGHTHRGQFAPNHLITKRLFELDWGYMRKGAMHVVVSSGFGSWGPPIRIGSRSEIIQLRILLGNK
ncbi:metallophosphoesterase [Cohnella cholangitidis]|uniref:Metallophosphoesterase n=1 Tax=Cohnella cholangitidis TaxID=2598458 RepID=A0A7G5C7P0_9BACL|nr:metallophosphoesterase [Cohnella cholangitidis]